MTQRLRSIPIPRPILGALAALALFSAAQTGTAGELHRAAQRGDLATVSALIAAGADIDETDGDNETALHKAAKRNHVDVVAFLLETGADPYISGKSAFGSTGTPLHFAARLGRVETLRVLLEAGIDPNLRDPGAGPPLHHALVYRRDAAADLLKSYGAAPIVAVSIAPLIAAADPVAGAEVANACRVCHLLQAEDDGRPRAGPTLWGILGRPKGTVAGFDYSDAMREAGGRWTYDDLNSFVANPKGFLPGTRMSDLHGNASRERRAALIRHLRDLSIAPIALPK